MASAINFDVNDVTTYAENLEIDEIKVAVPRKGTFVYEWKVLGLQIRHPLLISSELKSTLKLLAASSVENKKPKLNLFFNEWGTHFISESNFGWSMKFVSNNQKSGLSCDDSELENKISTRLNDLKKCLVPDWRWRR